MLDSGAFNPELLAKDDDEEDAGRNRAKARQIDQNDALIAHEYEEGRTGSHVAALKVGPRTELPIREGAREIPRAMEEGWRGR